MTLLFLYLVCGVVAAGLFFALRYIRRKRLKEQLQLKLMLIRLPYLRGSKDKTKEFEPKRDEKDEIVLSEQLITSLAAFRKPIIFEVSVAHIGEEIHFYVAVPERLTEAVVRQVQSLWANADVHLVSDYNIFNASGVTLAAYLKLKHAPALPIKTYQELHVDTFLPMLGGLAKINEFGEGAALQFVIQPAPGKVKKSIRGMLESLKKGEKLKDVLGSKYLALSSKDFIEAFTGRGAVEQSKDQMKERERFFVDESAIKAVEMKLSKPLFLVNIRVLASAQNELQAETIFNSLTAGFSQFTAPERNDFKVVSPRSTRELIFDYSFRNFNGHQSILLNSEELASLFHLPTSYTAIPRIKYLKSKEAPPPSDLVSDGVLIGKSSYRSETREIFVADDDRRRHIYIIGQTGTGKSNLLTNMIISDIRRGKGVCVIDPHGDVVETLLGLVPAERFEDVIVFDPSDTARPLGFNMLEYDFDKPEEKTFIVNEMQSIFNKLFSQETMGPMFEQYMRNALLLLMEDARTEPATLMEVARVFTDDDFRERKLERIANPTVIDFWEKEAIRAGGEAALSNMTPYITSKFNNFTANDYVRPIIGQTQSSFNFRQLMDAGKIMLVTLAKGKIGEINANLLGMIVVGKLTMAALGRGDLPQEQRRDFNLFIDEFQNFTTDSISTILSEARKYRLNLTIAHQFIAQLTEKIRDSVFGNVGSTVAMRVGAPDTEHLVKLFAPEFNEQDMMNIDNGQAYVKLLMRGVPVKSFNIKIPFAERGNPDQAHQLRELSRLKHGRNRVEVEEEIYNRLRD